MSRILFHFLVNTWSEVNVAYFIFFKQKNLFHGQFLFVSIIQKLSLRRDKFTISKNDDAREAQHELYLFSTYQWVEIPHDISFSQIDRKQSTLEKVHCVSPNAMSKTNTLPRTHSLTWEYIEHCITIHCTSSIFHHGRSGWVGNL